MVKNILNAGYTIYSRVNGLDYMEVMPRSTFITILLLSSGCTTVTAFGFWYSYILQESYISYIYLIEFVLFFAGVVWTVWELWFHKEEK